ncbi:hypothetical protein D9756_007857 [Leucocoprinus leucothites]|uniref:Uncharacterized protein n=1 Tax=Leucocoprinus leucothites TaxID=201217 RepID=A0A8H5FYL1_9AGAR|nr:hypothetical protein D9756_007857 [Leucoagaricus leucothites]
MAPRPILKRSSSSSSTAEKHAVHFPPSPSLTRTFVAHSPAAYDRSPIVVGPNICALPERGGRTYVLDEQSSPTSSRRRSSSKSGRVLHPRAIRDNIPSMPSLIPDLSSESDESDGFPSPHLENQEFFFGLKAAQQSDDAATLLSFLPYAPSNPYQKSEEEEAQAYLEASCQRRKERSRDASRIRSDAVSEVSEEQQQTRSPRRRSKSRSRSSPIQPDLSTCPLSLSDSFSSFALRDDGCLGGF